MSFWQDWTHSFETLRTTAGYRRDLVEALPTLEENRAKIEMLLKTDLGFLTLPLSNIDPSWSIPLTRIAQQMDKNE